MSSGDKGVELLQRTLDLIILRALSTMLADQAAWWQRSADLVNRLLTNEGE